MIYLKDATFIDWKTLKFTTTHLAVAPGVGGGIRLLERLPPPETLTPNDRVIDCRGKLVTRSFGCGHHHIYSALARGMPAPEKSPENFAEILQYVWWHLDKALDREMIEASALVSALHCVKRGTTFVIDHHASAYAIVDCLETIARAFDRVGISHLLCYEMSDRDGPEVRDKGLTETEQFLESGRQGHVGLHASFTVGNDLLKKAVDLAIKYRTGIHIHVAEDPIDQTMCVKQHGMRVVERFRDAGVLDLPKNIFSHCLHLNDDEKALIRESGAAVVQNTESNLNNNVGLTDYSKLGDNIILGTDGMHSDMLRSAKAAFFAGVVTENIDMEQVYRRFRKVHEYIESGGFSGDAENNLVILDYDTPTPVTEENFLSHFIHGFESLHVESVISSGNLIMENRKLVSADESEILRFSREMAEKLWRKMRGGG